MGLFCGPEETNLDSLTWKHHCPSPSLPHKASGPFPRFFVFRFCASILPACVLVRISTHSTHTWHAVVGRPGTPTTNESCRCFPPESNLVGPCFVGGHTMEHQISTKTSAKFCVGLETYLAITALVFVPSYGCVLNVAVGPKMAANTIIQRPRVAG